MGLQTLWSANTGDVKVFVPTFVNLTATTDPGPSNGPISIAITANATTVTTDILLNFLEINAMN